MKEPSIWNCNLDKGIVNFNVMCQKKLSEWEKENWLKLNPSSSEKRELVLGFQTWLRNQQINNAEFYEYNHKYKISEYVCASV